MAVIRFDSRSSDPPAFNSRQRELAVQMITKIDTLAHPQAIQIDFDAPRSAWSFYRQLLTELRTRIRPQTFLSITALVSWCDSGQSRLNRLPVDEVVPMAFSMGQATPATITLLRHGGQFPVPECQASIGLALPAVESLVKPHIGQRAYFFPGAQTWSAELLSDVRRASQP